MKQILVVLAAAFSLIIPTAIQADEGWKIANFDSQLMIQSDGHVQVTETINADFGAQQKHGIFRTIPYRYQTDTGETISTDITNLSVTNGSNPIPYSLSHTDTVLTIKIGDANKLITGTQKYVLTYTETGVLRRFNDADELYWNATGNGWPVPIEAASATVLLPDTVSPTRASCYQGDAGSTEVCNQTDFTHFAASRHLGENQGLTIAVGWPNGAVPLLTGTGKLPSGFTLTAGFLWQLVGGFGLIVLPGMYYLLRQYKKSGRDAASGPAHRQTIIPEYDPPKNLSPGEVGVLMDERADSIDLSATIIDLAVRGFLTVKEVSKTSFFGKRDYELTKTEKSTHGLQSYESHLLDAIFANGSPVLVSSLRSTTFAKALQTVKSQLYNSVTTKALFSQNPDTVRNTYTVGAAVLFFIGITGLSTGLAVAAPILFGITAGCLSLALLMAVASRAMPSRTAQGTEALRQAKGYKLFLTTVEKDRVPFFEKEGAFMQVMPYAMVFGVATLFAERLKDLGANPPQPSWYYGSHPFSPVIFASDMNAFSSQLNSAFAPVSSGSGSGGSGFSGGGFGGGGGGSW